MRFYLRILNKMLIGLGLVYLSGVQLGWADNQWPEVSFSPIREVNLLSSDDVKKFAQEQSDEAARQKEGIKEFKLFHMGDTDPASLAALLRWHRDHNKGFNVTYDRVSPSDFRRVLEELRQKDDIEIDLLARMIKYHDPSVNLEETKKEMSLSVGKLYQELRDFFEVPAEGVSFAMYAVWKAKYAKNRPNLAEYAIAPCKAVINGFIIHHSIMDNIAKGRHMNLKSGIGVAIAFGLFFDIFQRANSAFKGQSAHFDFAKREFAKFSPSFFFLAGAFHTFVMRYAVVIVSRAPDMTLHDFWSTFATCVLGLAGKIPAEIILEKIRLKYPEWASTIALAMWGGFWTTVQYLDQFEVSKLFGVNTGFYIKGILIFVNAVAAYKKRERIMEAFRNFFDRKEMLAKLRYCQTLMIPIYGSKGPE